MHIKKYKSPFVINKSDIWRVQSF